MKTFTEWLHEYAGMTVGMFSNTKQYNQSGVKSKWNAEGAGRVSYGADKSNCLYLKKRCKKNDK